MTVGRLTRAAMAPFDRAIQHAKERKQVGRFLCTTCWTEFMPDEVVMPDGSFLTRCKECGAPTDWENASGLAPGREEHHGRGRNSKG